MARKCVRHWKGCRRQGFGVACKKSVLVVVPGKSSKKNGRSGCINQAATKTER